MLDQADSAFVPDFWAVDRKGRFSGQFLKAPYFANDIGQRRACQPEHIPAPEGDGSGILAAPSNVAKSLRPGCVSMIAKIGCVESIACLNGLHQGILR